ncbi:MAG: HU family DNA-binding protein [Deltaproteobacteria bacterium]|jgi:DNA-binding protein HU-beta|nr:HU family DNA-binding protein [Deltaproteobacteria bacterium]
MTKSELIASVASESELSRAVVQKVLENVISTIIKSLKKESRFPIFGLGVFEVVKRPKRKGRNPRTGEPLTVKAHKAVKFRPAKVLKEAVNSTK